VERDDAEHRAGAVDPSSGRDVSIAGVGPVGSDAEKRDHVGMAFHNVGHLDHVSAERGFEPDVVIAR
jgi:hypothetical protein